MRRAQLSRGPSCCSRAVSRDAGGSVGAGPMAGAPLSRGSGHWEDFPALWECCTAGPALSGAEGKEWEPTQWLLSAGRGDSHQPHREQLAGNSSFPQISLEKRHFLWKRLCPVCWRSQICLSGLKCLFPLLLVMALPFFSLKHHFISKQSFRFKSNSKAPQYISKGLKPDGAQITCFLFFAPECCYKKKKKNSIGFLSPKQGACFFSKFPKFIIGKCLSFLASSSLYERMENIWRQCQGMLSCHFHVGFPWCERVSSCLFSSGKFPFQPQTLPSRHILRVSRWQGWSQRRVSGPC